MLVTGHSHLAAIQEGAALLGITIHCIRLLEEERGASRRSNTPERWERLTASIAAEKPARVICTIGGGSHVRIGAAQHPVPFDFIVPWLSGLPPDGMAQLVPYDAMRAVMQHAVQKHVRTLRRLMALGVPLVQLETPPPLHDNDRLAALLAEVTGERIALSHPSLRYKVWSLHSRVFRDVCAANGIVYVESPVEATDGLGFLKPCYAGDFTHGNAAYGALVLQDLARLGLGE